MRHLYAHPNHNSSSACKSFLYFSLPCLYYFVSKDTSSFYSHWYNYDSHCIPSLISELCSAFIPLTCLMIWSILPTCPAAQNYQSFLLAHLSRSFQAICQLLNEAYHEMHSIQPQPSLWIPIFNRSAACLHLFSQENSPQTPQKKAHHITPSCKLKPHKVPILKGFPTGGLSPASTPLYTPQLAIYILNLDHYNLLLQVQMRQSPPLNLIPCQKIRLRTCLIRVLTLWGPWISPKTIFLGALLAHGLCLQEGDPNTAIHPAFCSMDKSLIELPDAPEESCTIRKDSELMCVLYPSTLGSQQRMKIDDSRIAERKKETEIYWKLSTSDDKD
ncbi:hypothetical protein VP01_722g1 [Puccinia sorghi]|uniref:Uncharacterized protein n=1 Tax=Puccinia sorghi TaxID=27349 RepID=A0A0L6UFC4_9BASI|nr:hypothetical protein VP01_722g1 [Puccinia sorghi]